MIPLAYVQAWRAKAPWTDLRDPRTPLIGSLDQEETAGITVTRPWSVIRHFFTKVAEVIEAAISSSAAAS